MTSVEPTHVKRPTKESIQLIDSWKDVLFDEFQKDYMKKLKAFLKSEHAKKKTIYPKPSDIFRALNTTPFEKVKVVILGQDPYHGPGQAHGLSFSVPAGVAFPPSLQNIFKELKADLGVEKPKSGDLTRWAEQGVLLLNATLTVEGGKAGSHQNKGWEHFTDAIIHKLNEGRTHLVFILWGSYAQKKASFIDTKKHLVLKAVHPSPLSSHRGFFGSKPFSQTNKYLTAHHIKPIHW
jgi:uracil-DNA glycosylase